MPRIALIATIALAALLLATAQARAESIDLIWNDVTPPPLPELAPVRADPATTALLVLDIEERTCNAQRRPRCLETVPRIADLLSRAREAKMPVVYSLTPANQPETILAPVVPEPGEPIVASSVDKFWKTDLETILTRRDIKTVIVTGTAAHGAVLNTATAAGFRGLSVILPVDCLSDTETYVEQASVYLLLTGPATRKHITLTRSDMISMP